MPIEEDVALDNTVDLGSGGAILRGSSPLLGKYLKLRYLYSSFGAIIESDFRPVTE